MDRNTATFIRWLDGFRGDARLYKVSPPMLGGYVWEDEPEAEQPPMRDYVIVSAAIVPFSGPETYIFGADENGTVLDWGELDGSFRGALDHAQALDNAGYAIAHTEKKTDGNQA